MVTTASIKVKLLFLGMDGLDGKLIHGGNVPILDKLGTYGAMQSIPPYNSGPCWATIYTGLKPEDHGLTSGGWGRGVAYSTMIRAPTIWQQLPSVGVLNMPMTWSVYHVDGWMVAGFPALEDKDMVYPAKYERFLPQDYLSDCTSLGNKGRDVQIQKAMELVWIRLPLVKTIYNECPVDVLAIGYTFPDRLGHYNEYQNVIDVLQPLLEEITGMIDYDRLIIVSDHGIIPEKYIHSPDAFYLTNFGAHPKSLTDIYKIVRGSL